LAMSMFYFGGIDDCVHGLMEIAFRNICLIRYLVERTIGFITEAIGGLGQVAEFKV